MELSDEAENFQRLVGQYCDLKHRLSEVKSEAEGECWGCKKEKRRLVLGCGECEIYYCVGCRPPKHTKADHLGHGLGKGVLGQGRCANCEGECEEPWACDICSFRLCEECYATKLWP